ncbi:putative vanillate O-demethylase oxidoreductase [Exophiala viscosa]|uniref:Vanillate O-demethylase oxidoreductase n=1 Tax=Exophiala viscosa TaxID=2486360 RepID=A0AAN6DLM3_9EURO|nr:putative vanillate O-demethylase oxidoreductase [Exophiala viscosa]KAI1620170.1 putative vanillate O-demethylase oxidoreductase [Exophiala viscosa]
MTVFQDEDLAAIKALEQRWQGEKLIQVRTGKIKPAFGMNEPSAIFKHVRAGPITVSSLGCEGDEHAYEFHGGPEKALLQYSSSHYSRWKKELPQSEDRFVVGGFGENLVATYANERNMCIGDVVQIGTVIAQVCEPRQPCYKLNHRFQAKDISKRSQDLFRTGWFYRILKEGTIQAGDDMFLLERLNPEWTVARVQYYLYHDLRNEEAMRQLVEIKELGDEPRTIFANRLKKQYENQLGRLEGVAMNIWTDYRLTEKKWETPKIVSIVFEATEPSDTPEKVLPGSHVRLRLSGRLVRAYSVVAGDSNRFELAIALSGNSRGGSQFIHHDLQRGDVLQAGKITSSFPLSVDADNHVFIAGGVGITAFIASAQHCQQKGYSYHLHYLVRSSEDIALKQYLDEFRENITIYDKSVGTIFSARDVLNQVNDRAHIYCCGSDRLQDAVTKTARSIGIGPANLHFEKFEIATSGDPFTAELADTNKTIEVQGEQTLLDALREAGLDIPSSCEAGNCGTCRVVVKSGRIEHRGTGLMADEKGSSMLSCVSRGVGTIVLDL